MPHTMTAEPEIHITPKQQVAKPDTATRASGLVDDFDLIFDLINLKEVINLSDIVNSENISCFE